MASFSQLPAVKKDTILAARNFFDPSYFVTALDQNVYEIEFELSRM